MRVLELASARMQPVGSSRYGIGMDESDKLRPLAAEGLYLRAGGSVEKPQEGSAQFRAMSLSQMARFFLERGGCSCSGMSDRQVASALLSGGQGKLLATRSDFKAIFADVAHRRLVQAYRDAPATWRSFVNVVSASDFKPIQGITLSNAPDLLKVNENGEYKTGDLKASQETYRVAKYGRILSLTLEMIVDDDLRAFQRIPTMFGASASRLYGILSSQPFQGKSGHERREQSVLRRPQQPCVHGQRAFIRLPFPKCGSCSANRPGSRAKPWIFSRASC